MQFEGEVRSGMDCVIELLRSNPKTKFTIAKVRARTGLPNSFLKKWIDLLEKHGFVHFFYNIKHDEFIWVEQKREVKQVQTNNATNNITRRYNRNEKSIYSSTEKTVISTSDLTQYKQYSLQPDKIKELMNDINETVADTQILARRINSIKSAKIIDFTTLGITRHNLEIKNRRLANLLSQAKSINNSVKN